MRQNNQTLLFIYKIATLIIISGVFIYVFVSSQKYSILSNDINPHFQQFNSTVFMESFGYFTKSPKYDKYYCLYKVNDSNIKKLNLKNNSNYNLIGFSRKNRVRLVELGKITQQIDKIGWNKIKSIDFKNGVLSNIDTITFLQISLNLKAIQKGKYIVTSSLPTPWEFRNIKKSHNINYAAIFIKYDNFK